jgi:hypothetical protein
VRGEKGSRRLFINMHTTAASPGSVLLHLSLACCCHHQCAASNVAIVPATAAAGPLPLLAPVPAALVHLAFADNMMPVWRCCPLHTPQRPPVSDDTFSILQYLSCVGAGHHRQPLLHRRCCAFAQAGMGTPAAPPVPLCWPIPPQPPVWPPVLVAHPATFDVPRVDIANYACCCLHHPPDLADDTQLQTVTAPAAYLGFCNCPCPKKRLAGHTVLLLSVAVIAAGGRCHG